MYKMNPTKGRPAALTDALDELLVLTYGAIESTNVERWALAFGAPAPPPLPGTMRKSSYETDVVGNIHRMGQRYWLQRNEAAVWERPFPTGMQGRPPAVDIALFDQGAQKETRLEFGIYSTSGSSLTKSKLAKDAKGLREHITRTAPGYPIVENYILLWHGTRGTASSFTMTAERKKALRTTFAQHARIVTSDASGEFTVEFLRCAGGHLYSPVEGHHWVAVALFKVEA